ncbi:MAG: hypothetical protein DRI36_00450 [Caldiserica bacterium]|nr:MAG: hypothetical protein DRI36_00450 [Caldisericota bacterium]
MPWGDGTGPLGLGPMTGRAAGYCAGYPVPGYMNPIPGRGFWGWGRGWGWFGRGFGFWGRGRGWRWRWFWRLPFWGGVYPLYTPYYTPYSKVEDSEKK